MKTLITALVLGVAAIVPVAHAQSIVLDFPTQFPQDGVFEGKGLKTLIVKETK